jgi:hypothetical protein
MSPDGHTKVPPAHRVCKKSLGQGVPTATHGREPSDAENAEQRTGASLGHWGSGIQEAVWETHPISLQNFWPSPLQKLCSCSKALTRLSALDRLKHIAGAATHLPALLTSKVSAGIGGSNKGLFSLAIRLFISSIVRRSRLPACDVVHAAQHRSKSFFDLQS